MNTNYRRHSRRKALCLIAIVSLVVAYGIRAAYAQDTCVGPVTGVPNQPPGSNPNPDWFTLPPHSSITPNPVYQEDTDDPRWVEAGEISFGDGVSHIADLRALQDPSFLYFSWTMQSTTVSTNGNTILYFAFPQPGKDPLLLQVTVNQNAPTWDDTAPVVALNASTINSADGVCGVGSKANESCPLPSSQPPPDWFQGPNSTLRVWVSTKGPSPSKSLANSWAVEVRIPRSAVQFNGMGSAFPMWFDVQGATPASQNTEISWPTNLHITSDSIGNNVYPALNLWQNFQISSGFLDPTCAIPGISLNAEQIGTLNTNPNTGLPDPHYINILSANTFFAQPKNDYTARDVLPGEILARFRIANWGSSPDGETESGVTDDVLWSDVCTPGVSTICNPDSRKVPNADKIPALTTAHDGTATRNDNEFQWTLSASEQNKFVPTGTRALHQCMLVELTSSSSINPLQFVKNSARRNMDFAKASTFKESADLTIKGLQPIVQNGIPQPSRDIYIWVETLNMPKVVNPEGPPRELHTTVPGSAQTNTGATSVAQAKAIRVPQPAQLQKMLAAGQVTFAQVSQAVPTYIVHVYHDTGRKLHLGGIDRAILAPQDSFGYFVFHQGTLYGWEHSIELTSPGFTLETLAPDFYRIRNIPNDGTVTVVNKITAVEHKFAVFADVGGAFPHGTFSNAFDPGFSFNAGLEYIFNPRFSAEGILGVHHFPGKIAGDVTAIQFGGGGKVFLNPGHPNLFFARAGVAGYHFTSGTTNVGGYFGVGLLHNFTAHFGLEGVYTFHTVNTPVAATQFSTVQAGVRYAF